MEFVINSLTPVRPNDVGDVHYEVRVALGLDDREEVIDITAEQLTDFRQFQQIALAKTGYFLDLGLADCENEFDAFRRWQITLQNANWQRATGPKFDETHTGDAGDDQGEPYYKFVEE